MSAFRDYCLFLVLQELQSAGRLTQTELQRQLVKQLAGSGGLRITRAFVGGLLKDLLLIEQIESAGSKMGAAAWMLSAGVLSSEAVSDGAALAQSRQPEEPMTVRSRKPSGAQGVDPAGLWSTDRDALELLARMLVSGGYRVPVAGRGTVVPLSGSDVAGAVGLMSDPVAEGVAIAVATQAAPAATSKLVTLAMAQVERDSPGLERMELELGGVADRRLRLIVHDALCDLVYPQQQSTLKNRARATKLRRSTYSRVYAAAKMVLDGALIEGRREFGWRLFGDG
ncbi:MAG: hypothetical protein LBL59_08840 [Xanthomonadaceae bacterium]|jgi:hypothetical protein|nr:hypothetical protein [Xanthomonadaceae bacterium]